ncbi:hypothetical protein LEP1GSC172_1715 [Leptospira noguchii]|uniref:Uncharacterized protein n=1 Tax=Leptospira noguchii TaxID=28182 RepID=M6V8B4_9LEPT|nr:hypothetical protein LEP1GSC172_1715 [Leptospira noguchii]
MYIAAICLEWQNQIRFSALLILKKQTLNVSLAQGNSFFLKKLGARFCRSIYKICGNYHKS